MKEVDLVRQGYNRIAREYFALRRLHAPDQALLAKLTERLSPGARVLDAGCGAGLPITAFLAQSFHVIGVDFSIAQLKLASGFVPGTHFVCQDMLSLGFAPGSFDAICSFYAIIHIPRSQHALLFDHLHRLLTPGGLVLLCLGAEDLREDWGSDYFGTDMYWSHFDAATNLILLKQAGFEILWSDLIPDAAFDEGQHLFALAQKGSA